jgi:hypothetical protein
MSSRPCGILVKFSTRPEFHEDTKTVIVCRASGQRSPLPDCTYFSKTNFLKATTSPPPVCKR